MWVGVSAGNVFLSDFKLLFLFVAIRCSVEEHKKNTSTHPHPLLDSKAGIF